MFKNMYVFFSFLFSISGPIFKTGRFLYALERIILFVADYEIIIVVADYATILVDSSTRCYVVDLL